MAQTGAATARITPTNTNKKERESGENRFAQWTMVLFAELLNFFKPAQGIDNDPLLYKFHLK